MPANDKPLPGLPPPSRFHPTPTVATLSVDSRAHLRAFLRHGLREEGILPEDSADNEGEDEDEGKSWVTEIERALDELGRCLAAGGWLAGFRRERALLREAVKAEERKKEGVKDAKAAKTSQDASARTSEGESGEGRSTQRSSEALEGRRASSASERDRISEKHSLQTTVGSSEDRRLSGASTPARDAVLLQLGALVGQDRVPTTKPTAKHLLLTVSPATIPAAGVSEAYLGVVPARPSCSFSSGSYARADDGSLAGFVLFGLDEWNSRLRDAADAEALSIVGGSFALRGFVSSAQYDALVRVLRLAIFVRLSLILEQALLLDSHVHLEYPKPRRQRTQLTPIDTTLSPAPISPFPSPLVSPKSRSKPLGIWSFISKKRDDLLSRAVAFPSPRRSPLDNSSPRPSIAPPSNPATPVRGSNDTPRPRTFSFLSDRLSLPKSVPPSPSPLPPPAPTFAGTLAAIQRAIPRLSTSPGVAPHPPALLTALAAAEAADPARRPTGGERTALGALLGWDTARGKDDAARAREMAGVRAFVRHQGLSVLYSEHVPVLPQQTTGSGMPVPPASAEVAIATPATDNVAPEAPAETDGLQELGPGRDASVSVASTAPSTAPSAWALCTERRRWVTFRYYARSGGADRALGDAVREWCRTAGDTCGRSGCAYRRGEHERRYIHGGIRVCMRVEDAAERTSGGGESETPCDEVEVWERCKVCGKETGRRTASDATCLLSFAKLLELLIYSPALCTLTPALCEHTSPPVPPWSSEDTPLPRARLNIVRCFGHRGRAVTLALSVVEDIFDLRVPHFQIVRSGVPEKACVRVSKGVEGVEQQAEDAKRILRREIKDWWQAVADHLDKLEEQFTENESFLRKALPRLPSVVDEGVDDDDGQRTPRPQVPGLPDVSSEQGSSRASGDAESRTGGKSEAPDKRPAFKRLPTEKPLPRHSLELLAKLRHTLQRTEQALYSELSKSSAGTLNDVRRTFHSAARGAIRRLEAWQAKHIVGSELSVSSIAAAEPEWWGKGWHAVPGGHVIVREDDWGSIIAFTLSSVDYQHELADFAIARLPSAGTSSAVTTPAATPASGLSGRSYFTGPAKLFKASAPKPDPDQEGVVWHEPETWSAVISRKQHPRDPTYLLSLRDVLRNKRPMDGGGGTPLSQILGGGTRPLAVSGTPTSAWARPAVELSTQAVSGEVIEPPEATAGQILAEIDAASAGDTSSTSFSSLFGGSVPASSDFVQTHIRRGQASSLLSTETNSQAGSEGGATAGGSADGSSVHTVGPSPVGGTVDKGGDKASSTEPMMADVSADSYTMSITNSLTSAMRYMLKAGDTLRQGGMPSKSHAHHALLSTDPLAIDARPHVKYDFTVGKMRFSCTSYYAKQFDTLRRRCDVEDGFVLSMARSANWAADGGKSRSNFWKTADERYIIKTLVNAWNVADLQVLLELAPAYFRYMDKTANRATVLAKLLGFYTVEVRNLESGATQAKADLLVMENLFYKQTITKTFDLKGIQGRRVKAKDGEAETKTLFDGEWVEGQQHALTLVNPHSKVVLEEAISHDCEFLAESNIMDYSLLLGIDEERKEIACGLVDTIGSYTFAKTLEYKAKQGLAGKDRQITVVPPREYKERFVGAMDGYFLACPDKWCKPLDGTIVDGDPMSLPSVL